MKTRTRKNLKRYSKKRNMSKKSNMSKKRYSKKSNMSKKRYSKKRNMSKKRYSKKRNNLKGGEISRKKFLENMMNPKKEDEGAMDSAIFTFDQIKENPNRTSFLEDKKITDQVLRNLKFKKEDMKNRRKMFLNKIKEEESNELISGFLDDMDDVEFEDAEGCTLFDKESECLKPCKWKNNKCMEP